MAKIHPRLIHLGSVHYLWPGVGGVVVRRPPLENTREKNRPPPHDTVGKIPLPPCLKKTCLYVAVVLLQQL